MGTQSKASPELPAIMCDGVGWFSRRDYKRMLLIFSEILYLLPSETVEFEDVTGEKQQLVFPLALRPQKSFRVVHFRPSTALMEAILATASADTADPDFKGALTGIPPEDALYTWRAANSDGDLARGKPLNLAPTDLGRAHSVLMSKLLLAADEFSCTPISGRPQFAPLLAARSARYARLSARSEKVFSVVNGVVRAIVPDSELDKRSTDEIIEYKEANSRLYQEFWHKIRTLASDLKESPSTAAGEAEIRDMLELRVWKEKTEIEEELSAAWARFFGSATKALAGGVLAAALTPLVGLTALSIGAVLGVAGTAGPWLTGELVDLLERRRSAQKNGLCYLLGFSR